MPSDTSIHVHSADGSTKLFETREFLEIGPSPGLHYVLNCGYIGATTVTLPPEFNSLLPKDARIGIWRSVNGRPAQLEGDSVFLVRKWDYADDYTMVTALHANDLMRRRYNSDVGSGTGINITAEYADDAIKLRWYNNAGAGVDPNNSRARSSVTGLYDHDDTDWSAYVSIQINSSDGPLTTMYIPWLNLLDIIHAVEDMSYLNGTYLTAEIVAPTESTLELRTYTGQRGGDRRFSTGNGLLFTSARGNFVNGVVTVDATEELTFVSSLGSGERPEDRATGTARDSARMGESVFGRIEGIYDAASADDTIGLTNAALAGLRDGRPLIRAVGDLVETDTAIRGIHYDYGDLVTVALQGIQYDMRLDLLDVTLSGSVERTIARFAYNG